MDAYEATKVVFARLQALEPNLAPNIIGILLTKDNNGMDMIRLACGPSNLLQSIIAKVRTDLIHKPSSHVASRGFPSDIGEEASFSVDKVGCDESEKFFPKEYDWRLPVGNNHHQSFLSSTVDPPRWKTCLYSQSGVTMHLGSEDMQKYSSRPPHIDQSDLTDNPSARQIYLTFPPDSIFNEEDVCNYFSMYGMVQDVRIPYQEKRMFGFVTFTYQKTVKLILAKGNPHYICDARVLVKPYKEKEKVSNKFRHQPHESDSAGCMNPNRLLYSRGPFHLLQQQIGPRILYRDMASHEAFLRMKQDEQQRVTELQRRCLMRLPLLNLQNWGHRLSSPMGSHVPLGQIDNRYNVNGNDNPIHLEEVTIRDNKLKNEFVMREIASTAISTEAKRVVNSREEGKREFGPKAATPNDACGFLESGMEYNLPSSPFSSPTKASNQQLTLVSNISPHKVASSLFPPISTLELPPTTHASFKCQDSPLGKELLDYETTHSKEGEQGGGKH
uniref:RRM domain-containing protein n=1 Tax=Oryza punctata TaxID=4537 RepID=A0A0E0MJ26_ORYPU